MAIWLIIAILFVFTSLIECIDYNYECMRRLLMLCDNGHSPRNANDAQSNYTGRIDKVQSYTYVRRVSEPLTSVYHCMNGLDMSSTILVVWLLSFGPL